MYCHVGLYLSKPSSKKGHETGLSVEGGDVLVEGGGFSFYFLTLSYCLCLWLGLFSCLRSGWWVL